MLGRLAELYLRATSDKAERALALAERGLAMVAEGDPLYPKLLHVAACALRAAPVPAQGALGHDGRAARIDRDAWLLSVDRVPREAVLFATQWGDWAWQNESWDEAAEAYDGAAIALHRIVLRATPGILARLDLLSEHRHLGPRSAFAYLRAGRAREAVTVLERTGDLLCAAGSQRADLESLAALGRPALRDELLAAMAESAAARDAEPDAYGHLPERQRDAQERVDELVRQARSIPGMTRFAAPASWADVSEAAQVQPIAYLAATDKGTAVLVVQVGAKTVSLAHVPVTQADIWTAVRDFFVTEYQTGPGGPTDALMSALGWLAALMLPVHQAIGGDHPVLLIPFGLLGQLPLHAAAATLPGTAARPARTHVLFHPSHVTYAASARSWLACRSRAAHERGTGTLVVNNPSPLPPSFDELVLSDFERDAVARHLPITELAGRDATDDRVLDLLPKVAVAHLSCHGAIDKRMRYTGVLLVAGQRVLSVLHLEQSEPLNARLIFLSACSSGMSAVGVTQLISVPSALVAAGAAAVIATLWQTDQLATLLVVSRFYNEWCAGRGLADALGAAQEWLVTSPASVLRAAVPPAVLGSQAGRVLARCADDDRPFSHPWYWAPFFLMGT